MNKRINAIILALVMVVNMLATAAPAYAAAGRTTEFTITADKAEANPGDTITYGIALGAVEDIVSIVFQLDIPEGLTYVGDSGTASSEIKSVGAEKAEFTEETKVFVFAKDAGYTNTESTPLMSFQCTVDEATLGDKQIDLIIDEDEIFDTDYDNIAFTITNATVTVVPKPISVTGVTVDETMSLKTGESKNLTVNVTPDGATNKAVTFEVTEGDAATVDENGEVTGVKVGTATITVTTADGGFTDTCVVTVECAHANKTATNEKASDCKDQGWDAYSTCDACGQIFNAAGEEISAIPFRPLSTQHTGGTATCSAKAICEICEQPYGEVNADNHADTTEWTITSTTHKNTYKCCGAVVVEEEVHEYETEEDMICDECEYDRSCKHEADDITTIEAKASDCMNEGWNAYKQCECGKLFDMEGNPIDEIPYLEVDKNNHADYGTYLDQYAEPDHKEQKDGYTGDKRCNNCKQIVEKGTPITVNPHAEGEWSSDYDNHWKVCSVDGCGYVFEETVAPHEFETDVCKCGFKKSVLSTDIGEKTFVAGGDWVEFTFSTVANDYAGVMVIGGSDFGVEYEDKIAGLEYKAGDNWIDMKGQNFGGAEGFPMADATSTFRVKFTEDAAGEYNFTAAMKRVPDGKVLCDLDVPFTVNAPEVPEPTTIAVPLTKVVDVIGTGVAPEETFKFEWKLLSEFGVNNNQQATAKIADVEAVEGVTITLDDIATDGENEYEGEFVIEISEESELENKLAFFITEKNTEAANWTYHPETMGYVVEIEKAVMPTETEADTGYTVNIYVAYVSDNEVTYIQDVYGISFTNEYVPPVNYTIEIPFKKVVELGGNTAPGATNFEFELTSNNSNVEDWKVEGTTVETNGKGTFEGKLIITVAEEKIFDFISEGLMLVEKNTGVSNWTYDDTKWMIMFNRAEVNALDEERTAVDLTGWNIEFYKSVEGEGDQEGYEPAEEIVFTNKYTYNYTPSTPSNPTPSTPVVKPTLNKEDHVAFMQGYTDGTFGPTKNMTRGEVATMFARLLTEKMDADKTYTNTFTDVPADMWCYNYIGYMQQFGIITGYPDGSFRPEAPITRSEFAAIACRFEELTEGTKTFSDVPETHWAAKYISYAAERGWVTGYTDGTFKPDANITREEVVAVTCRLLERNADADYINTNYEDLTKTYSDVKKEDWSFLYIMEASNGHDYTKNDGVETWVDLH